MHLAPTVAGWLSADLQLKHVSLRPNQVLQALPAMSPSKQYRDGMPEDDPLHLPEVPQRQQSCAALCITALVTRQWQLRSITGLPYK